MARQDAAAGARMESVVLVDLLVSQAKSFELSALITFY